MTKEIENKKKLLFSSAMKGKWDKVIDLYKQDVTLNKFRFSRSGHTALHIAVCNGKEQVVKKMVDAIMSHNNKEALRTPNNRNNTVLHLAASTGNVTMCHMIASVEPTLVDDRNVDGETPLFLAALHGRKQAFLCLHHIRNHDITTRPSYDNCRRNNGDTFLHCAIKGNFFDIAFQIVHLYEDLGIWKNEEGSCPLQLLASKPCVFRSGSRLGRIEAIIYRCINVEKLKPENPSCETTRPNGTKDSDSHDCRPNNYKTLWDIFRLIRKGVTILGGCKSKDPEAQVGGSREARDKENPLFPANYRTCFNWIKFFYLLLLLIIFGKGYDDLRKIYRKKETHTWAVQIVKKILDHVSSYEYEHDGSDPREEGRSTSSTSQESTLASQFERPSTNNKEKDEKTVKCVTETPILVAAKNGVMEIIENIVESLPVALHDLNEDKKNMVLLAVEHRQPHVYEFLLEKNIYKESLFHQLDKDGNSALHLAATLRDYMPWLIPGEAPQMQWEHKWYQFVNDTVPPDFFYRYNNNNETPEVIFAKTHKELASRAAEWLNKTSESCSLVAVLIATVAFATAATVPGGVNGESGHPTLENELEFQLYAITALIALGSSITAVVMFLSILTSRFQEQDFNKSLIRKLLVGLTSLFMSIASMLVSFCAGHFFVLRDTLHYVALPIYVATCLPVTLFVLAQFPLYFDLLRATFKHVPQRNYRPTA